MRLERIEYRGKRAARIIPLLRKTGAVEAPPRLIVVDPRLGFGRPVLNGPGIPVSVIRERFDAGESVLHLAKDYGVGVEAIEEAVRAA